MGDHNPSDQDLEGMGVGLGDRDTVNKLQFIERLHALGVSKYIALPHLVVVGDQNSGKSSVLQAITKLPIPVNDTLCTRFATEVSLRRSLGSESISVSIKRPGDQDAEALDVPEFTNSPFGSTEFKAEFSNLLATASRQILGPDAQSQALSEAILQITAKGPHQINLTVVDLPGLVSATHPSSANARNLVNRYIENPRSIVIAVAVPSDPDIQEVLQIIKNTPDKENRVIGVVNKCDRKQEGADNWILDTIKNDRRANSHYYLSRGWYGLRNRLPSEKDTTNEERDRAEEDFFQQGAWNNLNQPARLGINNLRLALTKMHEEHIEKSIPELIPEIKAQLETCESRLAQLGNPRSTQREQRDCMVTLASDFTKLSTDSLDGHYHNLPDNPSAKVRRNVQQSLETFQEKLNTDFQLVLPELRADLLASLDEDTWRQSIAQDATLVHISGVIHDNRGREFPDEVNPNVMKVLWNTQSDAWYGRALQLLEMMFSELSVSIEVLMEEATADEELQRKGTAWLTSQLLDVTAKLAEEEIKRLIEDESPVWTLVPRYATLVGKLYNKYVSDMAKSLVALVPDQTVNILVRRENQIKLWLSSNKDVDAALITYVRLRAYYEVAMARFIDNVGTQVVERHLLGRQSPFKMFTPSHVLKMADEDPESLRSIAGENEEKTAEREEVNEEIASLKDALVEAQRYGFLQRPITY